MHSLPCPFLVRRAVSGDGRVVWHPPGVPDGKFKTCRPARPQANPAGPLLAAAHGDGLCAAVWPGQPLHQPAQRRGHRRVRLGGEHSLHWMERRALPVAVRLLRAVLLHLWRQRAIAAPCAAALPRAAGFGAVLPGLSAALHLRAARHRRRGEAAFRAAGVLRPALQPCAIAAHRRADGAVGALRAGAARLAGRRPAHLVRADRHVGVDDLPAPCPRRAGGRTAGRAGDRLDLVRRAATPRCSSHP